MVDGPDGPVSDACVIEYSNNLYRLTSIAGFGSRPCLDGGSLGVTTLSVHNASDVNRLVATEIAGRPDRFEGWRQSSSPSVVVEGLPETAVAVDGEARTWDPPPVRDPSRCSPGPDCIGRTRGPRRPPPPRPFR